MKKRQYPLVLLTACVIWLMAHEAQAFYNPSTGRWLSRDPIEEGGGNILYGFANNNPVHFFDKFGLITEREKCCACFVAFWIDKREGGPAKALLGENINWLSGSADARERILNDFLLIGQRGGKLGLAMFARSACGNKLNIEAITDADNHGYDVNWSKNTLHLNTAFHHYMYLHWRDEDFLGVYPESGAIMIAHELGHAFIDIRDPFVVYEVENPIRRAFGRPDRPRYEPDQEDHPTKRGGGTGLIWDANGLPPREISAGAWVATRKFARQKTVSFVAEWAFNQSHCHVEDTR